MGIEISNLIAYATALLFYILLLFFTIHTIFLAYHWFAFGTSKKSALTALSIYLTGAATLFLIMSISMYSL